MIGRECTIQSALVAIYFCILITDRDDDEEDSGMLYVIIEDIVKRHNEIIEKLPYLRESNTNLSLLIPEEPSEIYVTEFEPHHGIINE